MDEEKFLLRWDEFESKTPTFFKQMWDDRDFADVTLATADDRQITVHKVILSLSSNFFKKILLKNPHRNPLIYLKGIYYLELELILQFVYSGQVEVRRKDLEAFLSAGKDLGIEGLNDDIPTNYQTGKMTSKYNYVTDETNPIETKPSEKEADCLEILDHDQQDLEVNSFETREETQIKKVPKQKQPMKSVEIVDGKVVILNIRTKQVDRDLSSSQNHKGIKKVRPAVILCGICGLQFIAQTTLDVHIQKAHRLTSFICDICGFTVSDRMSLEVHKRAGKCKITRTN